MLLLNLLHVFLGGNTSGEEPKLFRGRDQRLLFGKNAFQFVAERRARKYFVHQLLDGRHQGKLAGHGSLQQKARDDEPVNFIRAFEDAIDAGIAVGTLGRVLLEAVHDAAGHRVDVAGRAGHGLGQHVAARVEDAGREVAALRHRWRERGPDQGHRLLLDGRDHPAPEGLQNERIEGRV